MPDALPLSPDITIDAFEQLNFDAGTFDHATHIYVAWLYLGRVGLQETIARYSATLRRLTRKLGVPEKYHETTTWYLLVTIAERTREGEDWSGFCRRNPDLFGNVRALLLRRYSAERLDSPLAQRRFVLPDLAASDTTS